MHKYLEYDGYTANAKQSVRIIPEYTCVNIGATKGTKLKNKHITFKRPV